MATLRLFAQARELAGSGKVTIDAETVGGVLDEARGRYGDSFGAILDTSRIWLNGAPANEGDAVGADDEVAILPPVSGG